MLLAVTMPGVPEMIIIALILVLLFGAKKLPELGGAIGKSIRSFKDGVEEGKDADEHGTGASPATDTTEPSSQISGDGK